MEICAVIRIIICFFRQFSLGYIWREVGGCRINCLKGVLFTLFLAINTPLNFDLSYITLFLIVFLSCDNHTFNCTCRYNKRLKTYLNLSTTKVHLFILCYVRPTNPRLWVTRGLPIGQVHGYFICAAKRFDSFRTLQNHEHTIHDLRPLSFYLPLAGGQCLIIHIRVILLGRELGKSLI